MENRKALMADCVAVYWSSGYFFYKDFPGEYFFMLNLQTNKKVRLYYDGTIIEG